MKITSSLAVKVGGGTAAGLAGTASTYYAVQHFSKDGLHSIEKELLEKNIKLTVTEQPAADKTITIQAQTSDSKTWSCKITVSGEQTVDDTKIKELASKIRDNLPTTDARVEYWEKSQHVEVKNLLIKACSNNKTVNDSSVSGTLTLEKKGDQDSFSFKDHADIDKFLISNLQEVEREVIEKDVKLKVESTDSKVTVTAENNGENSKLTTNYTWSCAINLSPTPDSDHATLKGKLQGNLFKENNNTNKRRWNKELLVRACHPNPSENNNKVAGTLTLVKTGSDYKFTNHSEIDHITITTTEG